MKKTIASFFAGIVLASIVFAVTSITTFRIERNDWLEILLAYNIQTTTDLWEKRYAVRVTVFDDTNEIVATITTANSEEELTTTQANNLKSQIESIIDVALEHRDWQNDYTAQISIF